MPGPHLQRGIVPLNHACQVEGGCCQWPLLGLGFQTRNLPFPTWRKYRCIGSMIPNEPPSKERSIPSLRQTSPGGLNRTSRSLCALLGSNISSTSLYRSIEISRTRALGIHLEGPRHPFMVLHVRGTEGTGDCTDEEALGSMRESRAISKACEGNRPSAEEAPA